MNEVLKQIEEIGIVPVVVLNDAKTLSRWHRHSARGDCRARRLRSARTLLKNLLKLCQRNSRTCW